MLPCIKLTLYLAFVATMGCRALEPKLRCFVTITRLSCQKGSEFQVFAFNFLCTVGSESFHISLKLKFEVNSYIFESILGSNNL